MIVVMYDVSYFDEIAPRWEPIAVSSLSEQTLRSMFVGDKYKFIEVRVIS